MAKEICSRYLVKERAEMVVGGDGCWMGLREGDGVSVNTV